MYIWIACDVSESLSCIRKACVLKNQELLLDETAFSLPQHISLKISFEVANTISDDVIGFVSEYLSEQPELVLDAPSPELYGSILWLKFSEDPELLRMHRELDDSLLHKFAVQQHEYDKDFKYHSTLFIDSSSDLEPMYRFVSCLGMPEKIKIDRFIIGVSESGKAGEYSVLKVIKARKK
jgi:2'-5' RNA ligase